MKGLAGAALLAVSTLASAAAARPSAPDPSLSAYARPGRMAAVAGGRRINLHCVGAGSPTVVLLAGLDGFSASFARVQGPIARKTRACAFDSAGFGFSDASPQPQDAAHIEADLEQALKAADIRGPYLLVGHSAGSYESLLFADRRRAQVAGMVLIDPSIPDQHRLMGQISPGLLALDRQEDRDDAKTLRGCAAEIRKGEKPDLGKCVTYFPEYPADLVAALKRLDHSPERLETQASLHDQFEASGKQAINRARHYGDLPLIVLTAGQAPELPPGFQSKAKAMSDAWMQGHDRLAALSTRGSNRVVAGAGHRIQVDKPEAVVAAVDEVLRQARGQRP